MSDIRKELQGMNDAERAIQFLKYIRDHIHIMEAYEIRINSAISALEEKSNNGWIPTSERLPEEHEREDIEKNKKEFLLQLENGFAVAYNDKLGWFRWYTKGTEHGIEKSYYNSVIAWQPLPERWEEDKNVHKKSK